MGKYTFAVIILFCNISYGSPYQEAFNKTGEALLRQSNLDRDIPNYLNHTIDREFSKTFRETLTNVLAIVDAVNKGEGKISIKWTF